MEHSAHPKRTVVSITMVLAHHVSCSDIDVFDAPSVALGNGSVREPGDGTHRTRVAFAPDPSLYGYELREASVRGTFAGVQKRLSTQNNELRWHA